jgi:enamine deaminase RidA (YjgF/YER057c/UK114 family)
MDGAMSHRSVDVPGLAPAIGFAHAIVAAPGRTVYLAGQAAHGPDGEIREEDIVKQFGLAVENLLEALRAAGGQATDVVWMQIFVTEAAAYRESLKEIGKAYRARMGAHYPAIALVEVSGLFDPMARVELMGIAVLPDRAED